MGDDMNIGDSFLHRLGYNHVYRPYHRCRSSKVFFYKVQRLCCRRGIYHSGYRLGDVGGERYSRQGVSKLYIMGLLHGHS